MLRNSFVAQALRLPLFVTAASGALALQLLMGCATPRPQNRAAAARDLFAQTVKQYHLPSAEATGPQRDRLLREAAAGYESILRQYRDQPAWCVQALRSLANVRTVQGRLDDAVKLYRRVGDEYWSFDWEVLQAWKSAADLLWDAGRPDAARALYRQIVARFEQPDAPAVIQIIVRNAQNRLGTGG